MAEDAPAGRLLYGDLQTGEIFALLGPEELGLFLKGFGEDAAGELYVLAGSSAGPSGEGEVLLIVPEPGSVVASTLTLAALLLARRRRASSGW